MVIAIVYVLIYYIFLYINSGCTDEQKVVLKELYQRLYPYYHVHFTPDFKSAGAKPGESHVKYDFNNKPYGKIVYCMSIVYCSVVYKYI